MENKINTKGQKMTKDTPEIITECWQLLVDYIPRREHSTAAELFVSYLESVLDKDELQAIADLDTELSDAYYIMKEEEEDFDKEINDDEND